MLPIRSIGLMPLIGDLSKIHQPDAPYWGYE
jgi:hypothetical protein